jgi:hypothetical protein
MMSQTDSLLGVGSRVRHPAFGEGVVTRLHMVAYDVCFMQYGVKQVGKDYAGWEIIDRVPAEEAVSFTEAERSLMKILRTWGEITEIVKLGDRWIGGTLILRPGEEGLKDKEMPIEGFFHKIVMTRDRLRVMEQRINSSNLCDEEKVNLQQYITKIYGSLTSFNILFRNKEDHFVGEKS